MSDIRQKDESGMALLPVLLLLTVLAFFLVVFLNQQEGASESLSAHMVHHLETDALDYGAQQAAQVLNTYSNWPEILTASNPQALAPDYIALPATTQPTTPNNAFWQSCAGNNECATYSETENGVTFTGEFVLYPANGISEKVSGFEDQQDQVGPTSRQYVVYVRVSNSLNSMVAEKEFVMRKNLL